MRNVSKWLLVLAVLAAVPAVASADGFLGGRRQKAPSGNSAQKQHNQQQADQVKAALRKARIDGYGISIEVIEGVVKLSGNVRTPSHLARAGEACQQVPGITRVVNRLKYLPERKVRSAAATLTDLVRRSGQQPAIQQVSAESASAPSNQQVAEQIGGSLAQSGLAGQSISIHYQNGIVTLTGEVDSAAQHNAATAAASGVPGVITVNNRLMVTQVGFAPKQKTPVSYGQPFTTAAYSHQLPAANTVQASLQMSTVAATPVAMGGAGVFSHPQLPSHAWPAYAQYPNSAAVTYPTQYSASAFPYIGPFYPYPQVPLGWREVRLQWDDGFWNLNFNKSESVWDILFNPSGK
jgi:osmotically-inducible protein OsmY